MKRTLLGLALFSAFNANANIINGDFESYNIAQGTYIELTSISGGTWGPTPNAPAEFLEIRNDAAGTAQSGDHFAELVPQEKSGIQQTFTVASTGTYDLSWYYAPREALGGHNDYSVSIFETASGLNALAYEYNDTGAGSVGTIGTSANQWTAVSETTTTALNAGTNYTLTFISDAPASTGSSPVNIGANIDNISLVSSVPEPTTYAMFLVGLGLLGFSARKRK